MHVLPLQGLSQSLECSKMPMEDSGTQAVKCASKPNCDDFPRLMMAVIQLSFWWITHTRKLYHAGATVVNLLR